MLIVLLILSTTLTASALSPRHGRPLLGPEIRSQLTDTQFEMICEEMRQMRHKGATRAETQAAVKAKLISFGVEVPDNWPPEHGKRQGPHMQRLLSQLSDDQRQAVENKIEAMHQSNATRREIRVEVHKMLEEYGVQLHDGCRYSGKTQGG
jgi:hypothetical protein